MSRLSILMIAFRELRGGAKYAALFIMLSLVMMFMQLMSFASHLTRMSVTLLLSGPVVTLSGYFAGMVYPYWRRNWIVRTGVVVTVISAIWVMTMMPAHIGLIMSSLPLIIALFILVYHEKESVYSVRGGAKVGDTFPDFNLSDTSGTPQNLTSILAAGPTLFIAYRGDW